MRSETGICLLSTLEARKKTGKEIAPTQSPLRHSNHELLTDCYEVTNSTCIREK